MYEDTQYSDMLYQAIKEVFTDREIRALEIAEISLYSPNGIRRYIGERSIKWFIKLYFPEEFYLDFAPIHLEMIADLQEIMERQVNGKSGLKLVKAIPRNHAKSTYYARVLPLHGLLYGWSKLTVLLGNNDDAARRLVSNIRAAVDTNERIQQDFPNIKGKYWGNEKLESDTGSAIVSFGMGSGSIRGVSNPFRPSLIIGDDIDDDASTRSVVQLATVKEWFDKSVLYLGDNINFTTSIIVIGTVIRKTSLLQYIIDSTDFSATVESAVKHFADNATIWKQWEEWMLEHARNNTAPKDPDSDTFYQSNKEEMLRGAIMLWERPNSYYYAMIGKLRNEKAFYSELQNQPRDNDNLLGNIEYVPRTDINEMEYELLAVLDSTTSGGKNNDQAAYVELLYHKRKREIIVWHIDSKQRSYSETIETIVNRVTSRGRRYDGFWVEVNNSGGVIKDLLSERFAKAGLMIIPIGVNNTLPKSERINTISEYMARGQIRFVSDIDKSYIEQFEMFPFHRFDDVPDATATVIMWLRERGMLDLLGGEYNMSGGWQAK